MGVAAEQGRCGHDLPRLAISALRNLESDPSLLYCMRSAAQALYRRDALPDDGGYGQQARTYGLAFELNCAAAAEAHAASEFRPSKADDIAQNP